MCTAAEPRVTRARCLLALCLLTLAVSFACAAQPATESFPTPRSTVLPAASPVPATPSLDSLDPTSADIYLWHSFVGTKEKLLQQLVADFEVGNPQHIHVILEYHGRLDDEVHTAISVGTPPDIVVSSCEQVAQYAAMDAIVPLDVYLPHPHYGLSQTLQSDLSPVVLQSAWARGHPGKPLGVLFDASAVVMYYNADWLARIESDEPPRNLEQFRSACSIARDRKNGLWGAVHIADGTIASNWILALGGSVVESATGRPQLNSAEAVTYLTLIRDQIEEGSADGAATAGGSLSSFASQKTLFTFGTTSDLAAYSQAILAKQSKFSWGVAPVPHNGADPLVLVQGSMMSIMRANPHQQLAAWLFMRWFLQPQNDLRWAQQTGSLLLFRSNQQAPETKGLMVNNPQYAAACSLIQYAQTTPAVPYWSSLAKLLGEAVDAVYREGEDPRSVLIAADLAARESFK
jgi:multiple sugar transport system substrate-binding protein